MKPWRAGLREPPGWWTRGGVQEKQYTWWGQGSCLPLHTPCPGHVFHWAVPRAILANYSNLRGHCNLQSVASWSATQGTPWICDWHLKWEKHSCRPQHFTCGTGDSPSSVRIELNSWTLDTLLVSENCLVLYVGTGPPRSGIGSRSPKRQCKCISYKIKNDHGEQIKTRQGE